MYKNKDEAWKLCEKKNHKFLHVLMETATELAIQMSYTKPSVPFRTYCMGEF